MISFNSKITQKVLSYFFLNPDTEMYLNEMSRKFEVDRANLSRKLREWEQAGILIKNKKGNLSLYKVNLDYSMYQEIKRIIEKKFGIENDVKKALKNVKNLEQAYIFGSYANNTMETESDIDLLLIGSHDIFKAQDKIIKLQNKYDREINVIDMDIKEFKQKQDSGLIKNIFNNQYIKVL